PTVPEREAVAPASVEEAEPDTRTAPERLAVGPCRVLEIVPVMPAGAPETGQNSEDRTVATMPEAADSVHRFALISGLRIRVIG
ncbi:MAG: hypothetical protein WCJ31_21435, partial [Planctomycetia bacterium]